MEKLIKKALKINKNDKYSSFMKNMSRASSQYFHDLAVKKKNVPLCELKLICSICLLFTSIESSLISRRFAHAIIMQSDLYETCEALSVKLKKISNAFDRESKRYYLLAEMLLQNLIDSFLLEFDELSGEMISPDIAKQSSINRIKMLQNSLFAASKQSEKTFESAVKKFCLKSSAFLTDHGVLLHVLQQFSDSTLQNLVKEFPICEGPSLINTDGDAIAHIYAGRLAVKSKLIEKIDQLQIYPNESLIWNSIFTENIDYGQLLVNYPFCVSTHRSLSILDYLMKNFKLLQVNAACNLF